MLNRTTSTLGALCGWQQDNRLPTVYRKPHTAQRKTHIPQDGWQVTGRKISESHFAISSLQSPVCGPRSPVSALCFLLGSQRLAQSVYTLPPTPYFLLGVLCPVEYPFHRSVIFSFTGLFHGESYLLSDSLNLTLTENFKYVWLVL